MKTITLAELVEQIVEREEALDRLTMAYFRLEAECDALRAENAALKKSVQHCEDAV